jgi:hypothetical protein
VKALTVGAALNAGSFEAQDAVTLGANLTVTGTADFSKTAGTALTATAADATITAAAITFSGNVAASISGSGDKIIFDGPVAFGGDLTLTAVPATFKGDVSFAETKKIVLTTDASVITLVKGIVLGTPVTGGAPAVYGSVIDTYEAASAGVTLTPADDTKLTFTAARTITQDSSSGSAAHGITIGGVAGLPAGATYTVASGENKVGTLTLDTGAELSLASGALLPDGNELSDPAQSKLVLTGAAGENGALLKGAGKVVAGATTISGGTGSWQAVDAGGNVEITANAITGTSTDAAFVAAANAGAITVGDHTVASTTFTVTSLAVNIVAGGTIAIPYPVSGTGNVFKLANSGASLKGLKITGTAGTTITGITNATVVGKSTVGTSGSAVAGNFIAGADGSTAATITGAEDSDDASVTNATAISSS